jgi:hypothetical protein
VQDVVLMAQDLEKTFKRKLKEMPAVEVEIGVRAPKAALPTSSASTTPLATPGSPAGSKARKSGFYALCHVFESPNKQLCALLLRSPMFQATIKIQFVFVYVS